MEHVTIFLGKLCEADQMRRMILTKVKRTLVSVHERSLWASSWKCSRKMFNFCIGVTHRAGQRKSGPEGRGGGR